MVSPITRIIRYPKNLNVPPPLAPMFYATVGFIAGIVFRIARLPFGLSLSRPRALTLSRSMRFDLISMFFLRLFYYAYWHILLGVVQL